MSEANRSWGGKFSFSTLNQCYQIGRFIKVLGDKMFLKKKLKHLQHFGYFERHYFLSKTTAEIWSHCLKSRRRNPIQSFPVPIKITKYWFKKCFGPFVVNHYSLKNDIIHFWNIYLASHGLPLSLIFNFRWFKKSSKNYILKKIDNSFSSNICTL